MLKSKAIVAALALAFSAGAIAAASAPQAAPNSPAPAPVIRYVAPTPAEAADLAFMREEEKLARDIYLKLHEQFDAAPFANIAASEQQHMDAVLRQLDKYRLVDPAAGKAIGEFANAELQALYDELLVAGSASLGAAYKVGGLIEETDIEDLDTAMANARQPALDQMYASLACGSRNHLRAFAASLRTLTGASYAAQVLPQATVDAILAAPMQRCGAR